MNEEEKAINFLKNKTTNYSLSGEALHYYSILYYLIINLQQENQQLKEKLEASEEERKKQSDKINNILDYIDSYIFTEQFENVVNERNVRKNILDILDIDKGEWK